MLVIVALYKHKAINRWLDKSFDGLLEILYDMLLDDNVILKSFYSMRKFLKTFDLGYKKIHACVNYVACLGMRKWEWIIVRSMVHQDGR